jgi:hypothetical protein
LVILKKYLANKYLHFDSLIKIPLGIIITSVQIVNEHYRSSGGFGTFSMSMGIYDGTTWSTDYLLTNPQAAILITRMMFQLLSVGLKANSLEI